jgi:hypothetical protein
LLVRRVGSQTFEWFPHFLIQIIVLAACFQKTGGFACKWPPVACKNSMRLAASHIQIVTKWPPVAYKLYPSGRQSHGKRKKIYGNLPTTGGHAGSICMRLTANRVQFECDWAPDAHYFCMRPAATLIQFVCDWPPDAHYFSAHGPSAE